MSWKAHWDDSVAKDRPSRVTYELFAAGPSTTKLHIVHDDFDGRTATYSGSVDGWPLMMRRLSSRKNSTTLVQHGPSGCTRVEVRSIEDAPPLVLIGRNAADGVATHAEI